MKHIAIVIALAIVTVSTSATVHSPTQHALFRKNHPCPATHKTRGACPGYVIDHIVPLDCGGPDRPSNMQWQTVAEGLAKDKWERNGPTCKHRTHGKMP